MQCWRRWRIILGDDGTSVCLEMKAVTKTMNELRLMFLMQALSDEHEWEELVKELSESSGLSPKDIQAVLYAMYELLAKNLPDN